MNLSIPIQLVISGIDGIAEEDVEKRLSAVAPANADHIRSNWAALRAVVGSGAFYRRKSLPFALWGGRIVCSPHLLHGEMRQDMARNPQMR